MKVAEWFIYFFDKNRKMRFDVNFMGSDGMEYVKDLTADEVEERYQFKKILIFKIISSCKVVFTVC